jgi:outer membrane biogenesis lipoprotein LolB
MRNSLLTLLALTLLCACGKAPAPPKPEPVPKLFETQRNDLDKAKALEGQMREAAAAQRKKIEEEAGR